jgi:hypothetical protein
MKVFSFEELHAGDCIATGCKLYLFPNGYYVIGGQSRSSDDNDEWHLRIDLLTEAGGFLEKLPVYYETLFVNMPKRDTWYPWNIKEFEYGIGNSRVAGIYNYVHHVYMRYKC